MLLKIKRFKCEESPYWSTLWAHISPILKEVEKKHCTYLKTNLNVMSLLYPDEYDNLQLTGKFNKTREFNQ